MHSDFSLNTHTRRHKIHTHTRQVGNGRDLGGKRKICRKERVGPVAAISDNNLESNKQAEGGAQKGTLGPRKNCTSRESVSPLSRLIRDFRNKISIIDPSLGGSIRE